MTNNRGEITPVGWEDSVVPLLVQGFPQQVVVIGAGAILSDSQLFEITQFRGVVIGLDYIAFNTAQVVNNVTEDIWNDALISLKGGGQDLIVKGAIERYDYSLDLGTDTEQLIHTRLAGGQTLESKLEINAASLSTFARMECQLLAYYSTKRLEEWRKTITWRAGTGLKRQDFKLVVPAAGAGPFVLEDVLPKNQGPIIGVSFMIMSATAYRLQLNFEINGINIVKDVNLLRWSRVSQREPYILYYPFEAGSKFKASVVPTLAVAPVADGTFFVTFYFDN